MDVTCYEVFEEEEVALRRHLPRSLQVEFSRRTLQAVGKPQPPSSLISIRTQSIVPPERLRGLSGVLTRSAGFDHLLAVREQSAGKVACGYLPSYCKEAVAEQALLMMLALARKLKQQTQSFPTFNRDGLTGSECIGQTLLVVGVGRIGSEIVRLAQGIGMRVQGVDLVKRVPSLKYVSLEEGVRTSDFIVCALPLTRLTQGMLDASLWRHVKAGAIFVNISRGEISPAQDLKNALAQGILGGVGLDVHEDESILADALRAKKEVASESGRVLLAMQRLDNVLLTPHNAFNTAQALERKAQQASSAIVAFLEKKVFPDPIPMEVDSDETS